MSGVTGWDQDPAVHERIAEVERRRAEARREEDVRAEDPKVRMLRCFDEPDPPERVA